MNKTGIENYQCTTRTTPVHRSLVLTTASNDCKKERGPKGREEREVVMVEDVDGVTVEASLEGPRATKVMRAALMCTLGDLV